MTIKIYNKTYNELELQIEEGSVYTENFDETLDSARVSVRNQATKLKLEPMDFCYYGDKGLIIASYNEIQKGVKPKIYDYEIELVSPTKIFEGIIAPNLSITKSNVKNLSVKDYIDRYFGLYVNHRESLFDNATEEITVLAGARAGTTTATYNKTKSGKAIKNVSVYSNVGKVSASWNVTENVNVTISMRNLPILPDDTDYEVSVVLEYATEDGSYRLANMNRFSMDCPEFQWNSPTLREIFNDLMMVDDCIPKARLVKENDRIIVELGFLDLSETNEPINDTKEINYINSSQSIENYASELRMDLQNVMQTKVPGVRNEIETEILHFTAANNLVTDENNYLETKFPILEIKELKMYVLANKFIYYGYKNEPKLLEFDITNAIHEYQEFITLPVAIKYTSAITNPENYQNFSFYFTRGDNKILNFEKQTGEYIVSWNNHTNLYYWFIHFLDGGDYKLNNIETENVYFSTFFKITYTTQSDQVFKAGRTLGHSREIQDNQTNSWVDAYSQGFLEYLKVKRLSNQVLVLNQYATDSKLAIQDTLEQDGDKYIIYQTQEQRYKNYSKVVAYATKDYVLRNYWTGINSRIRTWKNATNEALVRHELEKEYLEFSFDNGIPCATWQLGTLQDTNEIKYSQIKTYDNDDNLISDTINQLISRVIGDSIVFTFGFNDSAFVGSRVSTDIGKSQISVGFGTPTPPYYETPTPIMAIDPGIEEISKYGINLKPIPYVEQKDFTFRSFAYILGDEISMPTEITDEDSIKDYMLAVYQLPQASNDIKVNTILGGEKTIFKDNREIFKMSLQYEYYSDSKDIYFTKLWLEYNTAIRNETKPQIECVYGTWENGKKSIIGTSATFQVSGNAITFTGDFTKGDGIYIIDSVTNEVVLGCKAQESGTTTLYLNAKKSRVSQ